MTKLKYLGAGNELKFYAKRAYMYVNVILTFEAQYKIQQQAKLKATKKI